MKENDRIIVQFPQCNCDEVFTVYKKNGELGIDFNTKQSPTICNGDMFTPFRIFASAVVFENVDTGERYRFDTISNSIVML